MDSPAEILATNEIFTVSEIYVIEIIKKTCHTAKLQGSNAIYCCFKKNPTQYPFNGI